jgi:coenzyme F420-reducing hydrogenase alpha subunit
MAIEVSKTIEINPVSRIEGHGKVTIQLDDSGNVADAKFEALKSSAKAEFSGRCQ